MDSPRADGKYFISRAANTVLQSCDDRIKGTADKLAARTTTARQQLFENFIKEACLFIR